MRRVEVVPYDESWPELFKREAAFLQDILHDCIQEIHHIGSTAVPGFFAKPTIDIMLVVESLHTVDVKEAVIVEAGYKPRGENGIKNRRFYTKDVDGKRKYHLHFFEEGSPNIIRHIALREYLKAHPNARRSYGGLKRSLAWEYPFNMKAYVEGKHEFVRELECRAIRWYNNNSK